MSSYKYAYMKLLLLNTLRLSSGMLKKEIQYLVTLLNSSQMLQLCMGLQNIPE